MRNGGIPAKVLNWCSDYLERHSAFDLEVVTRLYAQETGGKREDTWVRASSWRRERRRKWRNAKERANTGLKRKHPASAGPGNTRGIIRQREEISINI